jgi:hypothetical protein
MGLYVIDDCVGATCLVASYTEDVATPPTLQYEFPAAGTYYLVVDGETGSCGPFELTGEIRPTAVGAPRVPAPALGNGIWLRVRERRSGALG